MDPLFDIVAIFSLVLIVWVLSSVRRAHIRVEYSVSWLLSAVLLFVLSRWPGALESIGSMLGISDAPSALLIVAGCIFLIVLFRLSLRISGLKDSNIALAQRVAILEFRLESLQPELQETAQHE